MSAKDESRAPDSPGTPPAQAARLAKAFAATRRHLELLRQDLQTGATPAALRALSAPLFRLADEHCMPLDPAAAAMGRGGVGLIRPDLLLAKAEELRRTIFEAGVGHVTATSDQNGRLTGVTTQFTPLPASSPASTRTAAAAPAKPSVGATSSSMLDDDIPTPTELTSARYVTSLRRRDIPLYIDLGPPSLIPAPSPSPPLSSQSDGKTNGQPSAKPNEKSGGGGDGDDSDDSATTSDERRLAGELRRRYIVFLRSREANRPEVLQNSVFARSLSEEEIQFGIANHLPKSSTHAGGASGPVVEHAKKVNRFLKHRFPEEWRRAIAPKTLEAATLNAATGPLPARRTTVMASLSRAVDAGTSAAAAAADAPFSIEAAAASTQQSAASNRLAKRDRKTDSKSDKPRRLAANDDGNDDGDDSGSGSDGESDSDDGAAADSRVKTEATRRAADFRRLYIQWLRLRQANRPQSNSGTFSALTPEEVQFGITNHLPQGGDRTHVREHAKAVNEFLKRRFPTRWHKKVAIHARAIVDGAAAASESSNDDGDDDTAAPAAVTQQNSAGTRGKRDRENSENLNPPLKKQRAAPLPAPTAASAKSVSAVAPPKSNLLAHAPASDGVAAAPAVPPRPDIDPTLIIRDEKQIFGRGAKPFRWINWQPEWKSEKAPTNFEPARENKFHPSANHFIDHEKEFLDGCDCNVRPAAAATPTSASSSSAAAAAAAVTTAAGSARTHCIANCSCRQRTEEGALYQSSFQNESYDSDQKSAKGTSRRGRAPKHTSSGAGAAGMGSSRRGRSVGMASSTGSGAAASPSNRKKCGYTLDSEGRTVLASFEEGQPNIFECNSKCACAATAATRAACPNRVLQNVVRLPNEIGRSGAGVPPHLKDAFELFRTPRSGWGVRTSVDLPAGTFAMEYMGEYITANEAMRRDNADPTYNKHGWMWTNNDDVLTIDATKYGSIARFVNHSCVPNLIAVTVHTENRNEEVFHVAFFTRRHIPAGKELTLHYGHDSKTGVECFCGEAQCLGHFK